ncbi:MAG: energy transducer TonB [Desulfomonilaceae bacterium]
MQAKGMTVALSALVMCAFLIAPLAWSSDGVRDAVVVDRTTRDKALNDYTHLTRNAIQKSWNTPIHLANIGALKGKVAVNYCISRDGRLESVELVRSSGNEEMDRTLLEAIRAAAPFPAFPDYLPAKRVLIKANFIVAETPLAPVTMAQHAVTRDVKEAPKAPSAEPTKKFNWGVSAGNAGAAQEQSREEAGPIPAPPAKKYKWGLP